MPSTFAFYRPRGIAGTYVVGIQLDLRPTETVRTIVLSRHGLVNNIHISYLQFLSEEILVSQVAHLH